MTTLLFRGRRTMLPDGEAEASIRVRDGRIVAVDAYDADARGAGVIDAENAVLLPGLVDTHVHVNEPGRSEWEGFDTATRSAAAGGVTTILDMPLNAIPATTNVAALHEKVRAARGKCHVDVGFIGGVVPGNAGDLEPMADAGVLAWKCFLVDSGVPEFAASDERTLRQALPIVSRLGLPLMVHAELPGPIERACVAGPIRSFARYAATRPESAEVEAVQLLIELAAEFAAPIHVVHLTSRQALRALEQARASGVPITVETCPHYLTFDADSIPDGATEFKCAPPIRSAEHREALWAGLQRGSIDAVVSDHSPCPVPLKHGHSGDCVAAWGGIASLQLGLSVVWHAARARGIALSRVLQWMSSAPASLAGLAPKGRLAVGCDADVVLFDPDAVWTVDAHRLAQRHPVTPYHGMQLTGRVRATWLRGQQVYANDAFPSPGQGRLLLGQRSDGVTASSSPSRSARGAQL